MDEILQTTNGAILTAQLERLAAKYFPNLNSLPGIEILDRKHPGHKGAPAWLNAVDTIIYIDECVAPFKTKTTQILILHELMHYKLYQGNGDPDDEEGERFRSEVNKLWDAGAYAKLL